ncbi:aldose 1-epimerase [Botrimarina sp.]|uniref:aldose 1-epimerase n=1 Tax=Botrimarina sp. TaxID=2795802 RepID=UPI0032EF9079
MPAEVVHLTAADSGATADVLVGLGMNCFSWRTPFAGDTVTQAPHEILWAEPGFESGELRPSSSGIPLLAPFPGRIAGPSFEWNGKRYELEANHGEGVAIHGFALRAPWRLLDRRIDKVTAEFTPTLDAPETVWQWPSDYRVEATYSIAASHLTLDVRIENTGDESMPLGFATHAYFRLPLSDGADPESTLVCAPVDGEWLMQDMIPTGELKPVEPTDPLPSGAPLDGQRFDTPYRLVEGEGATELVDPSTGRTLRQTYDESMRCCVVYTPGHREAICLEPYTCLPNPFAMEAAGVATGLRVLQPGEAYSTRLILEATCTPKV